MPICTNESKIPTPLPLGGSAEVGRPRNRPRPLAATDFSEADRARFWSKVDRSPHPKGCWSWKGTLVHGNYGVLTIKHKPVRAHRAAYVLTHNTECPLFVCHGCDNPNCVNPDHLFAGTIQDNTADRDANGRSCKSDSHWTSVHPERIKHGSEIALSKLTEQNVSDIRKRAEAGEVQRRIAEDFNVTPTLICNIVKRKVWRHIP